MATFVTGGLKRHPFRVVTAAIGRFWARHTDADVVVVQGVSRVFPVSPHGVIPVGILPLGAQSGGKSGIAQAKVSFVIIGVGSASDIAVGIGRPSVFTFVGIPFRAESRYSVVSSDTFMAPGEFFAKRIDSVLGWSSAAGNSVVSWEAVTSIVLESFGNGGAVPR